MLNLSQLFFSFLHFILCYLVFIALLVSNNLNHLVIIFFILVYIKILYLMYGRCILTILENSETSNNIVDLTIRILTGNYSNSNLSVKDSENIFINLGLLMVCNKILFLQVFSKYKF